MNSCKVMTIQTKQKKQQLERDLRYFIKRLESAILVNPKEQDKNKVLFSAFG